MEELGSPGGLGAQRTRRLRGRGIARHGYPVLIDGKEVGVVTSGSPSITLGTNIGLAYVPEERRIVPGLTVLENLRLGLIAGRQRHTERERIDEIAQTFPRLAERMHQEGTSLSGGEQQMLAIARAMMSKPRMILLDEPSEGIMPLLVHEMFELFARMKREGTTILLVEQNVERALSISDRAYILDQGQIAHEGRATDLLADREIQERYCAV